MPSVNQIKPIATPTCKNLRTPHLFLYVLMRISQILVVYCYCCYYLEAVLLLVTDELVISLEHQQTLFTLIIEARGASEAPGSLVIWVQTRLILINLASFLTGDLKPHNNHTRTEAEQFGQILQVIILGIRIVFEKLLQHFDLIVCEPGPVSAF